MSIAKDYFGNILKIGDTVVTHNSDNNGTWVIQGIDGENLDVLDVDGGPICEILSYMTTKAGTIFTREQVEKAIEIAFIRGDSGNMHLEMTKYSIFKALEWWT